MANKQRLRRARRLARWRLIPLQASLVVLWLFLWGEFSWTMLAMGVVVAALVPAVFYLPPIESTRRFHVGWALWFVMHLLWDIVRSSVVVAAQALGWGYRREAAVIGVRLRTRSDLVMTATAEASTLVPGTLVIDVDRERRELYLHVFSVRDAAHIERARREVLQTELRVIRAFGSAAELRRATREEKA